MKKRKIRWDKPALIYFSEAIRYIRKDSAQNAEKVKQEILARISELSVRPENHAPDKYKQNNAGNYRAFELHRYRVAYLVKDEEIIIARVRHTSQEPQSY
ncbi:MAG: type II toxin-antitoxin system RelE/ParE family toxin [Chitinophagaceae bacterium]|nr:type II toxin-antitoxin system RelE/ParE family toxin [Chitinophagaceae bacterium]